MTRGSKAISIVKDKEKASVLEREEGLFSSHTELLVIFKLIFLDIPTLGLFMGSQMSWKKVEYQLKKKRKSHLHCDFKKGELIYEKFGICDWKSKGLLVYKEN